MSAAARVTIAGVLVLVLATGPLAAGAPLTGWFGHSAPEKAAGEFLREAGLHHIDGLPRFAEDTTELAVCDTLDTCALGQYPPADGLSIGILPVYQGTVTLRLHMGRGGADVLSCTIPGDCPVLATGSAKAGPFKLTGEPAPGTAGAYVVWVTYSD